VTRAVVVVNPAAGGGRTARIWRRLRDVMAATLPAEHAETRGPGDGERLAREAAASGAALVVAVGGDGTLNEIVNGVRSAGAATSVGAVLTGRGCDACRNFGVPRDPLAAVRALADGHDARFDRARRFRSMLWIQQKICSTKFKVSMRRSLLASRQRWTRFGRRQRY